MVRKILLAGLSRKLTVWLLTSAVISRPRLLKIACNSFLDLSASGPDMPRTNIRPSSR